MKRGLIGGRPGEWRLPPCRWPGCNDAGVTTGLVGGSMKNLCQKHKAKADQKLQKGRHVR